MRDTGRMTIDVASGPDATRPRSIVDVVEESVNRLAAHDQYIA